MIPRPGLSRRISESLRASPVVALLGPRQCGKTTMVRAVAASAGAEIFDLEDAADINRLSNPRLALGGIKGLVVLDEAQRLPGLFALIRVLVDEPGCRTRFLLTGSASPRLVRGVTESLAGRVSLIEMGGFDLTEAGTDKTERLWLRGGQPRSFLAASSRLSMEWRGHFISTFLERDIPQLGIAIPAPALRRFWTMVAHYHGQVWNAAEFARSIGSSEPTARRYLDLLTGAFMVRQLQPWHENLGKRQVKSPKVYIRDSGLLHALLSVETMRQVSGHPKYGASWEGFALEQVLSLLKPQDAYFWGTHAGAELDLMVVRGGRRTGFEFKCAEAPGITKSMRTAIADLGLERLFIVCPGAKSYPLERRVEVVALEDLERVQGRRT